MKYDRFDLYKWYLGIFILIATIISILCSCSPAKRAQKQVNSAIVNHPKIALNSLRNAFPCIVTNADTLITLVDSIVYIECPDPVTDYFTIHDTILSSKTIQLPAKTIRVPVTLPVKTITIVKEIEDLAQIRLKDIELTEMKIDRDKLDKQNTRKGKTIKWLVFFLIGLAIPYIIRVLKIIKL